MSLRQVSILKIIDLQHYMRILITTLATVLYLSYNSVACTCQPPPVDTAFMRSDVVFRGKVISQKVTSKQQDTTLLFTKVESTLRVSAVYKGKELNDTIIITTYQESCGFVFDVNEDYIVFSSYRNELTWDGSIHKTVLMTELCDRTMVSNRKNIKTMSEVIKRPDVRDKK